MPLKPANWKSMNQLWVCSIHPTKLSGRQQNITQAERFFSWLVKDSWTMIICRESTLPEGIISNFGTWERRTVFGKRMKKICTNIRKIKKGSFRLSHVFGTKLKYTFGFLISLRPGYVSHTCSRVLRRSCGLFEELAKTPAVKARDRRFDSCLASLSR